MDIKCKCGSELTLSDQEVLSGSYTCPECGTQRKIRRNEHPRPWVAGLLSLLFPGLGHLYAGGYKYAISLMCSSIVISILLLLVLVHWDANPFNVVLPIAIGFFFPIAAIVSAVRQARTYHSLPEKPSRPKTRSIYIGFAVALWAVEYFLVPGSSIYHSFSIPTSAMESTVRVGDVIIADLHAYNDNAPLQGDIVVFLFPGDQSTIYLKRCIAVGGDVVEVNQKQVFVNGERVTEAKTIQHIDPEIDARRDNFGPYRVPKDSYFMMGDNRDDSYDSRYWGPVPKRLVLGRVVRVVWSDHTERIGLTLK